MADVDVTEARSENEDVYDRAVVGEKDEIRGAILNDALRVIEPSEPILCPLDTSVRAAVDLIKDHPKRHGAVCVVDADGKLVGIFSERDVLNRVLGKDKDLEKTTVADVMTKDPIALSPDDKIGDALHHMSVRGFRNIPIVKDGKPIGIVFTRHFVKFIVSLFPEGTLNRRVGGVKNPDTMHSG